MATVSNVKELAVKVDPTYRSGGVQSNDQAYSFGKGPLHDFALSIDCMQVSMLYQVQDGSPCMKCDGAGCEYGCERTGWDYVVTHSFKPEQPIEFITTSIDLRDLK